MTDALRHHRGLPSGAYKDPFLFAMLSFALPGLLATSLIGLGAIGVGWLPLDASLYDSDIVDTIRNTTAGTWLSRLMVFFGVGLLLQTWLVLGSDLNAGLQMRFSTSAGVLAAWTIPLLLVPPLFSRDVYSYFAQGRLLAEGYDPYSTGVSELPDWFVQGVDPLWGETPSPYGPLFLIFARGVAALAGDSVFLGALLFRLFAVAGVIAMLYLVPRLAAYHGIDGTKAIWLTVLNPLVIMHFVAGAHNDAVMVALILAGFALASRGSILWGASMIALAASIKPIAIVALPFIGIMRHPRDWTWRQRIGDWALVTVVAGGVFFLTAVLAGLDFGWVQAFSTPGAVKTWLSPMTALGMIVGFVTQWVGWTETNDAAVAVFRTIGIAISVVICTYLAIKPQGRSGTRGAGLVIMTIVILGPVVQPWYLLWFIPLLVVTGLRRRPMQVLIIATAALSVHGMVDGSATSDAVLEFSNGVSVIIAVAFVAAILLLSPRERRLMLDQDTAEALLPETPAQHEAAAASLIGPPQRPQQGEHRTSGHLPP